MALLTINASADLRDEIGPRINILVQRETEIPVDGDDNGLVETVVDNFRVEELMVKFDADESTDIDDATPDTIAYRVDVPDSVLAGASEIRLLFDNDEFGRNLFVDSININGSVIDGASGVYNPVGPDSFFPVDGAADDQAMGPRFGADAEKLVFNGTLDFDVEELLALTNPDNPLNPAFKPAPTLIDDVIYSPDTPNVEVDDTGNFQTENFVVIDEETLTSNDTDLGNFSVIGPDGNRVPDEVSLDVIGINPATVVGGTVQHLPTTDEIIVNFDEGADQVTFNAIIADGPSPDGTNVNTAESMVTVVRTEGPTSAGEDDTFLTFQNLEAELTGAELLANDFINGGTAEIVSTGNAQNGTVWYDGSTDRLVFNPDHDFVGVGSFDYTVEVSDDTGTPIDTYTAKASVQALDPYFFGEAFVSFVAESLFFGSQRSLTEDVINVDEFGSPINTGIGGHVNVLIDDQPLFRVEVGPEPLAGDDLTTAIPPLDGAFGNDLEWYVAPRELQEILGDDSVPPQTVAFYYDNDTPGRDLGFEFARVGFETLFPDEGAYDRGGLDGINVEAPAPDQLVANGSLIFNIQDSFVETETPSTGIVADLGLV